MARTASPPFPAAAWLRAAAIVLAGAWAFAPGMAGGWLWDDDQYVTQNPLLHSPAGLGRIWLGREGVNYFPLTETVRWIQWHLWGDRPLGYHLTNLALHLAAALLVWGLAARLRRRAGGAADGAGPWLAGLLFAVHPLTVESVAWVAELKNTLSLPLALLAMIAYVEERSLIAGAFFLCALLSKSTVAMLPLVFLAFDAWRQGRVTARDLRRVAPCLALAAVAGAVTIAFERSRAIGAVSTPLEGVVRRAAAAGLAAWFYLGKCLLPAGLSPIYPRWSIGSFWWQWLAWPAWAAVAAAAWTRRATWGRHALFGLGAFLLGLLPVLGLVPMAYLRLSWVADHFAYVSLVSVAILGGAALGALPGRTAAWTAGAALAAILAVATHAYVRVFLTPESLWTRTLARNPGAWSAHNDLGSIRFDQGRLPEAAAEFAAAVRLNPRYPEAYNNLGVARAQARDFAAATDAYHRALALKPAYPEALCNLGNALLQTGRIDAAIASYREALRLRPDFAEARYNLNLALGARG